MIDREKQMREFRDYLGSPECAARRKTEIRRAGHRCELCQSSGTLVTRHLNILNFDYRAEGNVVVLCPECHAATKWMHFSANSPHEAKLEKMREFLLKRQA